MSGCGTRRSGVERWKENDETNPRWAGMCKKGWGLGLSKSLENEPMEEPMVCRARFPRFKYSARVQGWRVKWLRGLGEMLVTEKGLLTCA